MKFDEAPLCILTLWAASLPFLFQFNPYPYVLERNLPELGVQTSNSGTKISCTGTDIDNKHGLFAAYVTGIRCTDRKVL
jgi:hypothetical protein